MELWQWRGWWCFYAYVFCITFGVSSPNTVNMFVYEQPSYKHSRVHSKVIVVKSLIPLTHQTLHHVWSRVIVRCEKYIPRTRTHLSGQKQLSFVVKSKSRDHVKHICQVNSRVIVRYEQLSNVSYMSVLEVVIVLHNFSFMYSEIRHQRVKYITRLALCAQVYFWKRPTQKENVQVYVLINSSI